MRVRQVAVSHAPVGVDSPPPALNGVTNIASTRRALEKASFNSFQQDQAQGIASNPSDPRSSFFLLLVEGKREEKKKKNYVGRVTLPTSIKEKEAHWLIKSRWRGYLKKHLLPHLTCP
eukprot:1143901-Pelagomonas_calceolata.AAC.3